MNTISFNNSIYVKFESPLRNNCDLRFRYIFNSFLTFYVLRTVPFRDIIYHCLNKCFQTRLTQIKGVFLLSISSHPPFPYKNRTLQNKLC